MAFRHFRIGVIWRVLLLTATLLLLAYLVTSTRFYVSIAIISMVAISEVIWIIRYVELTNSELVRFLDSVRYSDFSQSFNGRKLGRSFDELGEAFTNVMEQFRKERSEKEENFRYLQTIIQHIGVGLISFNQDGEVELINTAAKRLFDLPAVRNLSALEHVSEELVEKLQTLNSGDRALIKMKHKGSAMQLAVSTTHFRMRGQSYTLASLQNINDELEEKEMEAWQNITRVLAHEIMNSITPISSLTSTLNSMLEAEVKHNGESAELSLDTLEDVQGALRTIHKRSNGLMAFVNSYRDFTRIPKPNYEQFEIKELLTRVRNLMQGEWKQQQVAMEISVEPESLELTADSQLIEQVLINMVKNALRALADIEDPVIELRGYTDEGRVCIDIVDNGRGIKPKAIEKIFIPFYSTKRATDRKGTGIGLSLSRQIMRQHNGSLSVYSEPGESTRFTLRF